MSSSPSLKHQAFRLTLRHQVWLTTHVRNHEDLIGLISPSKRSTDLVCQFRLTLWNKVNFTLLVSDRAYIGLNRVIPDELYVYPGRPNGLEYRKDAWREIPHNAL